MAGESFEQLLDLGEKSKRTSIEGVGLNQDIEEAQAIQRHQADVQKVRQREKAISAKVEENIAKRREMKAKFGVDDPRKAAAIEALGVLGPDFASRVQIDPEGAKAAFDRAVEIAGKGGVQDIPDGPPRQFSEGVGAGGERYFTNLSREELKQEQHATEQITGEKRAPRVTGLKTFRPGETGGVSGGSEGAVQEKPIEDILFEGKLDEARALVEKPEKDEKRAIAAEKYFDELWGSTEDIRSAREKLQEDWFSGEAKKRGLRPTDIKSIDAIILKRGRTIDKLTDPGIDKQFFKPWVKRSKPGQGTDQAQPATVLNPGGGIDETTKVKQANALALSDAANNIANSLPREQPTAYQYAKGTASPQPRSTPAQRSPSPKPGTHLKAVTEPNPIDELVRSMTPAPGLDPEEALRRKRKDADPFGIGF